MEMTSSTSVQNPMQSCPSPIVYFPLLAPSNSSRTSWRRTKHRIELNYRHSHQVLYSKILRDHTETSDVEKQKYFRFKLQHEAHF